MEDFITVSVSILVFLHLLGMAYLVGGLLIQLGEKKKKLNRGVTHGAITQLITGTLLFGIAVTHPQEEPINHMVVGLKILLLLFILITVGVNNKSKNISNNTYYALLFSAISAVGLAVFL